MRIRHFASQALRLTWSVNAHPLLSLHPATTTRLPIYPLFIPPLPLHLPPHPYPYFVICLFGDARLLPGLFVLHGKRLELEKVHVCVCEKLLSRPEWALKNPRFFEKQRRGTAPLPSHAAPAAACIDSCVLAVQKCWILILSQVAVWVVGQLYLLRLCLQTWLRPRQPLTLCAELQSTLGCT